MNTSRRPYRACTAALVGAVIGIGCASLSCAIPSPGHHDHEHPPPSRAATRPLPGELLSSAEATRRVGALMREQRWQEALDIARNARLEDATRESLIGLIMMRTGRHEDAIQAFRAALSHRADLDLVRLYLAWSLHARGDFSEAEAALVVIRSEDARSPLYWLLRGRVARDMNNPKDAYALLLEGHQRHPEHLDLTRELGLTLAASSALGHARPLLVEVLQRRTDDATAWRDATLLIKALAGLGHEREALLYAEIARARWPARASDLDAMAAHLHARLGEPLVAARLFIRAMRYTGRQYSFEAADQLRMAGRTSEALRWNARVTDDARRRRQGFMILVEGRRWARAAYAGAQLDVAAEMNEPALRYRWGLALLYGAVDLEGAREQLRHLGTHVEAQRLRAAIDQCTADQGERCW